MEPTVINQLIEGWTQEARTEIYSALTKLQVGTIKLDNLTNTWCVPLKAEAVPAKSVASVCSRVYTRLRSAKLIILEPQFEQIEREIISEMTAAKIERTWWRTRIVEPGVVRTRTIEHRQVVKVPRAIWRIRGMFVGCDGQFPMETDVSGDLFSPEGTMSFHSVCEPGLDITVQIENLTTQAMPFYAVVVGDGNVGYSDKGAKRPLTERA